MALLMHFKALFRASVISLVFYVILYTFASWGYILHTALLLLAFTLTNIYTKILWDPLSTDTVPDLSKKAVVITGCDTGFGNRLARKLDKKGVTVFAGCLFSEGPDALKLKQECSDKLHIVQMDVTKDDDVKGFVQSVSDQLGEKELWAVVNNAGIFVTAELEYTSLQTVQKLLEVNTTSVVRVTQAFLPMLRKSRGRVVITASITSHSPVIGMGAYSMSKFAVLSFADHLRAEMIRFGVSVHTIEPWIYKTGLADEETLHKNMQKEWNQAPETVREEYGGESYLQGYRTMQKLALRLGYPSDKIHQVVDCLYDAAVGDSPKARYSPGHFERFLTYCWMNVHSSILALQNHVVMSFFLSCEESNMKKKLA